MALILSALVSLSQVTTQEGPNRSQGRKVFGPLSVEDNLFLGAFRHLPPFFGFRAEAATDLAHVYELFPRIEERRGQYAGTLSGGEQQVLAIGER